MAEANGENEADAATEASDPPHWLRKVILFLSGQTISLLRPPFDLGFLHYASDTPYSKGMNLGSRNLSYFGMDPTYATSLAVARRILNQEVSRLG